MVHYTHFNPRPREEGDNSKRSTGFSVGYFNPRPREEGDLISHHRYTMTINFNPRPREEGDSASIGYKPQSDDFNPRPREEGDKIGYAEYRLDIAISIHALVKRATPEEIDEDYPF